jgi:hypothetical protein
MSCSAASPLVDVAFCLIAEDQANGVPSQLEPFVRAVISSFVANGMSANECKVHLSSVPKSTRCIGRLNAILRCPEQPLPSSPVGPPDPDGKRRLNTWTTQEDNRLLCAIHRFGMRSWPVIASFVGNNRTRSQCAQRWRRSLDPRLSKGEWTAAEDAKLVSLVGRFGNEGWTSISQKMGNRSDVQCRYRHIQLTRTGKEREPRQEQLPVRPVSPPQPIWHFPVLEEERRIQPRSPPTDPSEGLIDWNMYEDDDGITIRS